MKRLIYILSLFIALLNTSVIAQSPRLFKSEFKEYNLRFNQYSYLYGSSWRYLKDHVVKSATIHTEKHTFHIKFFRANSPKQEYYFRKIMIYTIDSAQSYTTKIEFHSYDNTTMTIDAKNSHIQYHVNERLNAFAYDHLIYLNKNKILSHKQQGRNASSRRRDYRIGMKGSFSEVISRNRGYYLPRTIRGRVQLVIKSYYDGRASSLHWSSLTSESNKYHTTYFLEDKGVLYSLSILTSQKIYDL